MIYQELEKDLLGFVSDPIKNKAYLKRPKLLSLAVAKFLSMTKPTQKVLSPHQSKILFENSFVDLLNHCSPELLAKVEKTISIENPSDLAQIIRSLRTFFNFGIQMTKKEDSSQALKEQVSSHINTHLLTKFEYHSDRITEIYDLPAQCLRNILDERLTWTCFYLSEIYLLLNIGLLTVRFDQDRFEFEETRKFEVRRKTYWYSEVTEFSSNLSNKKLFFDVSKMLFRQKYIDKLLAKKVVDYVLDKYFSINVKYLPENLVQDEKYLLLRECLYFSFVIECKTLQSKQPVDFKCFLNDPNIRSTTLSLINAELAPSTEAKISGKGGLFYRKGIGEVYRGPLGFKHGIRKFASQLLSAMKTTEKGKDFLGELGKAFEHDYVVNYLKGLSSFGYTVHTGFKANRKSLVKGYDVDLVIEDTDNDIYYFVQAKYKFTSNPTYFSEQFELFGQNTFKKGYIDQLITLRENFEHEEIRQQLKSKGLSGATITNSYFLLLHNLPFLNFYEHKGVLFYEWNLLRNVLKNSRVYWQKDNAAGVTHGDKVPLYSPRDMVDAYLDSQENGKALKEQYSLFKRTRCFIKHEKMKVSAPLI